MTDENQLAICQILVFLYAIQLNELPRIHVTQRVISYTKHTEIFFKNQIVVFPSSDQNKITRYFKSLNVLTLKTLLKLGSRLRSTMYIERNDR